MFLRLSTASVVILMGFSSALAGPLGLSKGMSEANFANKRKISTNTYVVETVPNSSPLFDRYVVQFGSSGLCFVKGIGNDIPDSSYGTSTQKKFVEVESALEKKYGVKSDGFDFIKSGALWDDDDEWMMSIMQEERYRTSFWNVDKGAVLSDDIDSIYLSASAVSRNTGYIALEYYFDNYDQCDAEASQSDTSSL